MYIGTVGEWEPDLKASVVLSSHNVAVCVGRWLGFRLDMMSACIVFGAALFAVLGRGSVTAGLVGLSISYALQATSELNWMVRVTSDLECNVVSVERVREYTETPAEVFIYFLCIYLFIYLFIFVIYLFIFVIYLFIYLFIIRVVMGHGPHYYTYKLVSSLVVCLILLLVII